MKFYSDGRPIAYDLRFSELDRELCETYRAKRVPLKTLWDYRPACGIDDLGNQVELSDEEKTVELYTEGEISSEHIACYVLEDRAVLHDYFRSPLLDSPKNIVLVVELDKEMNFMLDLSYILLRRDFRIYFG